MTDLVLVNLHTADITPVQKVRKLANLSERLSPDGKKLLYVIA